MSNEFIKEVFGQVPGRFQAAMQFLEYCKSITDPCQCCNSLARGRALAGRERTTYDAALDSVRLYLSGEVDLSGPAMAARAEPESAPAPEPWARIVGPGLSDPAIEAD